MKKDAKKPAVKTAKKTKEIQVVKKEITRTEVISLGSSKKKRKMEVINSGENYWKPEIIGDSIEGIFNGCVEKIGGQFGEIETREINGKKTKVKVQHPAEIVNEETGESTFMPTSKVVDEFFRGNDKQDELKKGTYVKVTYTGKKLKKGKEEGEDNSTYNTYLLEKEIE